MARIHSMTIEAPITKVMCNCCWLLSVVLYWNTTTQGSNKASRQEQGSVGLQCNFFPPSTRPLMELQKTDALNWVLPRLCSRVPSLWPATAWSFWRILAFVEEETGVPPSYLRIINCLLKPFKDLSKITSSIKWQRQMEEGYTESIQSHLGAVPWTGKY